MATRKSKKKPTKKAKRLVKTKILVKTPYEGSFKLHPEDEFRSLNDILSDCKEIELRIKNLISRG